MGYKWVSLGHFTPISGIIGPLLTTVFWAHFVPIIPKRSTYEIFTYIYHKSRPDVGKNAIHGAYGINITHHQLPQPLHLFLQAALQPPNC